MVSCESYEFHYEVYLAEQDMFNSLFNQGNIFVNESANIVAVNEAVKETIIGYLKKISESIQKAWNRFLEIVGSKADKVYFKSIEKRINEAKDPKFTIVNYRDYDITKLLNIKLPEFNYEEMKQYLDTKDNFISQYFSDINSQEGKNLSEKIDNMVVRYTRDERCTVELLQRMYKFCTTDYDNYIEPIKNNIKSLNVSNRVISDLANKVIDSQQSATEAVAIYESFIHEAEEKKNVKFEDDPDRKKDDHKAIMKHISTFYSACTDVLSAQMRVFKNIYNQNKRTINHYIKPTKKEKSGETKAPEGNSDIQVEV